MKKNVQTASLENPFDEVTDLTFSAPGQATYEPGIYEEKLEEGFELRQRPFTAAGERNIQKQHLKGRMTIWERIRVLTQEEPAYPSLGNGGIGWLRVRLK